MRMIMSAMSPSTSMTQLSTNAPSWPDNPDFSMAESALETFKTGDMTYQNGDWSADPLLDAFLVHPVAFTPAADWERIFGADGTFS